MSGLTPKTPLNPREYAFVIPGVTPRTLDLSKHLLEKNHAEHHIFFNKDGFHNHLIHHLLAAYSMGADTRRLQEIYDYHASYQRKLPPPVQDLDRDNFRTQLGNREAYTSFLNMFTKEIDEHGMVETIRRWVWSEDFLARTIGGAYHPLIHLGYALEFNLPGVAAEALAMAACTDPILSPLVSKYPSIKSGTIEPVQRAESKLSQLASDIASRLNISVTHTTQKELENALKNNPIIGLVQEIHKDAEFDDVVKFTDPAKIRKVLRSEKAVNKLKAYASKWKVEGDKLEQRMKELYEACMLVFAASGIRERGTKLDFFLAHAVTSIHAVHIMLPHINAAEAASLLEAHAATTLAYYVSRGRPSLQFDLLAEYETPLADKNALNPWLSIFNRALKAQEEHVIKVVRACAVGQIIYGSQTPFEQSWMKAAAVTLDIDGNWDHGGIGFDEDWK